MFKNIRIHQVIVSDSSLKSYKQIFSTKNAYSFSLSNWRKQLIDLFFKKIKN